MSSSRRSSPSSADVGSCPSCGSSRVRKVCEAVVLTIRGKRHRFAEVPHERCAACGEMIFGLEASKMFDCLIRGKRRSGPHAV